MREWLVDLRKSRNESQAAAARGMGLSRQSYFQVENGERQKRLTMDMMVRIAGHFEVTLDQIVQYENARTSA